MTPEQSAALIERLGRGISIAPRIDECQRANKTMAEAADLIESLTSKAGTDEVVERALAAFNGGIVRIPESANPRGYVDMFRPKEAMRAALAACQPMVEEERLIGETIERCAKVADRYFDNTGVADEPARRIAQAIRNLPVIEEEG